MYIPAHFNVDELAAKHALIEAYPFGTMIVALDGKLEATHIPFLLDRNDGPLGTLRAHIARANPSWRAFDGKAETLATFLSVDGYISPDWYESAHQVPTWNYVAVHAHGIATVLDDEGTVRLLDRLSARHEGELAPKRPWTADKLDADYFVKLRRAIIAFEIAVTRLEGKAKLSQNKTASDVAGAAAALDHRDGEKNRALAAEMRRNFPRK